MEIKDQDILEVFKLGEKIPGEKVFHGVQRKGGRVLVVFERNSGEPYTGFLENSPFDLRNLTLRQIDFLKSKGYEL